MEENDVVREEMQRRTKLRTLCDTCWASRANSLYTFRMAYSVLIQAIESLSSDEDGKARGYLCSIRQFDFMIALFSAEYTYVLSNTVALLNMLQGKHVDMIEAANESVVVINRRPKRGAK